MSRIQSIFKTCILSMTAGLCWVMPATAQTVTSTVGTGNVATVVENTGAFTVTGGTAQFKTLFHSFESFSPNNLDVHFKLDDTTQTSIENVIARVTGGDLSFINSELSLTGGNSPDLFLINPQGIHFGAQASLSLPGSFIGSTAESVLFPGGLSFSAREPGAAPSLLTMSAPIGLQLGANSAPIRVNNTGHQLASINSVTTVDGLRVGDGESLVLVGGDITLEGGVLTALGGRIELGAIGQQQASTEVQLMQQTQPLVPQNSDWILTYNNLMPQGSIQLLDTALANVGGTGTGSIQTQSGQLSLQSGSAIQNRNSGDLTAGPINLNATDTVALSGTANNGFVSGIYAETVGTGQSSDIEIGAEQLLLQGGGNIASSTYGAGNGGNITINVNNLQFTDTMSEDNLSGRIVATAEGAKGSVSGDITINTQRLDIEGAGSISTFQAFSEGVTSGNVVITATEAIRLAVTDPANFRDAIISASVISRDGKAGNITLTTPRLSLEGGALISSSTFGAGSSGNITVNASESVLLTGERFSASRGVVEGSGIRTAGILLPAPIIAAIGFPETVTGSAGNVVINTPQLSVLDNAIVTVRHESEGDAGTLSVNADIVRLDQGGQLTAETALGEGGSVSLQVDSLLSLRNESTVTATAGGFGNGGNVFISSPVILGLENSDIAANAENGSGGNVTIVTDGLIGLALRAEPTLESDITASSELGVSGTVEVTNFDENLTQNVVVLSDRVADASDQITQSCAESNQNQFLATGRGGMTVAPSQDLSFNRTWRDTRPSLAPSLASSLAPSLANSAVADTSTPDVSQDVSEGPAIHLSTAPDPIIEVTDWHINSQGQVELMAHNANQSTLSAQGFCSS